MKKYEYKEMIYNSPNQQLETFEEMLNIVGAQGWKLHTISNYDEYSLTDGTRCKNVTCLLERES